jgi:hypothetical protein
MAAPNRNYELEENNIYWRVQHVSCCITDAFETYFPPSAFIELCESYTEDGHENACSLPVKHTLCVFGFYGNLSKTQDAWFYSKDA